MIYNPSPGIVYFVGSPEFVDRMPVRTELTVLEGDDMVMLRKTLHDLLNLFPDADIEALYSECLKDAEIIAVLES